MSERLDRDPAWEQEVASLFERHLPVQPLPVELAHQLNLLVMAEVAVQLRLQSFTWLSPLLGVFKRITGATFYRRR
jgi:hypothetical protein